MLLRRMGRNHVTTLYRRRDVYDSNGSRRTTMAFEVNGLERTINALETSFIGIRF